MRLEQKLQPAVCCIIVLRYVIGVGNVKVMFILVVLLNVLENGHGIAGRAMEICIGVMQVYQHCSQHARGDLFEPGIGYRGGHSCRH